MLAPLLAVIPLQLLAYSIARAARTQRRPAAQPRQDRHGRVSAPAAVGIDLVEIELTCEIERMERALTAGSPQRLFTDG